MSGKEKARERKLRNHLAQYGYLLRKSRLQNTHYNNEGGYMIVDAAANSVVRGSRFELDLDDVEHFLGE